MTAGDAARGVKPMGVVDYGQFDAPHIGHDWHRSSTTTNPMANPRRFPFAHIAGTGIKLPGITVSREWIAGVKAAYDYSNQGGPVNDDDLASIIGGYVLDKYEEAREDNA